MIGVLTLECGNLVSVTRTSTGNCSVSACFRVAALAETVGRQVSWRGAEVKQGNNWRDEASFREPASGFTGKRNSAGDVAAESDRKWSTEPNVRAICAGVPCRRAREADRGGKEKLSLPLIR